MATWEFTHIDMGLQSESIIAHTRSNASIAYFYTPQLPTSQALY